MKKMLLSLFGHFSILLSTANSLTDNTGEIYNDEYHLSRSLDVSRTCAEELSILRKSEEFQVQFPTLTKQEYEDHCVIYPGLILCDLNGTSLVSNYRKICEDEAGGKMVQIQMTASGECVNFVNITFQHFPLCAGKSCNAGNFIESYEAKLKTENIIMGSDCELGLDSSASSISQHLILLGIITFAVSASFIL